MRSRRVGVFPTQCYATYCARLECDVGVPCRADLWKLRTRYGLGDRVRTVGCLRIPASRDWSGVVRTFGAAVMPSCANSTVGSLAARPPTVEAALLKRLKRRR